MNVPGFIDYDVDVVVKFGGSLLARLEDVKRFAVTLGALRRSGIRIVVVPGGGPTDKTIEAIDRQQRLSLEICHRACALAQDQTGLVISDESFSDALRTCDNFEDLRRVLDSERVAVLLPSRILFALDPIERTWDVTSDAVAAWVAWLLSARSFAIATDVDGVFSSGRIGSEEHLLPKISARDLVAMGHTAVDRCAAEFLLGRSMDCFVFNGKDPERLGRWLTGEPARGTHVTRA